MRFVTALILSISFAVAGENATTGTAEKPTTSRTKSFFRTLGSFGGGLVVDDPYQEVRRSSPKQVVRPASASTSESAPSTETLQPPVEKSETPQPQK